MSRSLSDLAEELAGTAQLLADAASASWRGSEAHAIALCAVGELAELAREARERLLAAEDEREEWCHCLAVAVDVPARGPCPDCGR